MTYVLTMKPKLNGPGTNFCPPSHLAIIGVTKPIYWLMMLIVNTAAMATGPANEIKARMSAINARKHEA